MDSVPLPVVSEATIITYIALNDRLVVMPLQDTLAISSETLKQIIDHAYAEFPYEVCGLMGGHENIVEVAIPVANASLTPHTAFELERQAMVDEIVALQRANLEVVAIYHSHPNGPAEPSERDVAEATWPDAVYVIVGLVDIEAPDVRAWMLRDGTVELIEIVTD
jgi:proteasome lid subunit RPN8/RPN11